MTRKLGVIIVLAGLFTSCESFNKKETSLQVEVDSLRTELVASQKMTETLQSVGSLLDSIDANRHYLRTSMIEGLAYDTYTTRMSDINEYVKTTQQKIEELENVLKTVKSTRSSYAASLSKLKKDLALRNQELAEMTEQVSQIRMENENLKMIVSRQGSELDEHASRLLVKEEEVTKLETEITMTRQQSKSDLAESYYLRAQALELAAKRTNFAPKRKKNTKREALELYKLAVATGKSDAQPKVDELEKEI